ncbi:hypothetical protein [Methanosarcina sp. 2.H.T.1A.15]|nr:hypothetical protein [Methanosarcina sp. 2.H.T.1A.15]
MQQHEVRFSRVTALQYAALFAVLKRANLWVLVVSFARSSGLTMVFN